MKNNSLFIFNQVTVHLQYKSFQSTFHIFNCYLEHFTKNKINKTP